MAVDLVPSFGFPRLQRNCLEGYSSQATSFRPMGPQACFPQAPRRWASLASRPCRSQRSFRIEFAEPLLCACRAAQSPEKTTADLKGGKFVNPTWHSPIGSFKALETLEPRDYAGAKSVSIEGNKGKGRAEEKSTVPETNPAKLNGTAVELPPQIQPHDSAKQGSQELSRDPSSVTDGDEGISGEVRTVPSPSHDEQEPSQQRHDEVHSEDESPYVTYILRLGTSKVPGSAFTDSSCSLQVAILGQSGQAISARVYPNPDSKASPAMPEKGGHGPEGSHDAEIAHGIHRDVSRLNTVFSASGSTSFSEGGSAVVCLRAADLRPIEALWLAPLDSTWRLASASLGVLTSADASGFIQFITGSTASPEEPLSSFEIAKAGEVPAQDTRRPSAPLLASDAVGSDASLSDEQQPGAETLGTVYVFKPDEWELLGETGDATAVQLRPCASGACSQGSLLGLLEGSTYLQDADALLRKEAEDLRSQLARDEGMRDYEQLKAWLILTTSIIVVAGTFVASQVGGDSVGAAFAAGGLASLLFLFRLQREVDSLPVPLTPDQSNKTLRAAAAINVVTSQAPTVVQNVAAAQDPSSEASKFKLGHLRLDAPIILRVVTVGVCFGVVALVLSQSLGSNGALTAKSLPKVEPEQLFAAFLGFLSHKVSVIMAAFRRKG